MHRTAWFMVALFMITPASGQQITGVLAYDGPVTVDAAPGETVTVEGVVERSCPPGYLAAPAVTEVGAGAPPGFAVTTEAPTFEQQVCTLEPTQQASLRVTVFVPQGANATGTHAVPVWIQHPDQPPPYPPMTYEDLRVDLLVHVTGNDSAESARLDGEAEPASVATPALGPAPLLLGLCAVALALRRL